MAQRLIKVFGERNTATRAVLRMVDAAPNLLDAGLVDLDEEDLAKYDVMIDQVTSIYAGPWKRVYREAIKDLRARSSTPLAMWKHAAPIYDRAFRDHDAAVLFMVRNPYSWVQSLHRRPYHCMGRRQQALEDFLVFPWLTLGRDNVEPILSSPIYLWSLKLAAYERFAREAYEDGVACTTIRFEDFVQNPVFALTRALGQVDIDSGGLRSFPDATKPQGRVSSERKAYYLNELWREELTSTSVNLINDMVDWSLAERAGYTMLDPSDFPDTLDDGGLEGDIARSAVA